jgi:hypothetical protein
MKIKDAIKYIGHYVDDAGSSNEFDVNKAEGPVTLVGWQCGTEPMFVAIKSYIGVRLSEDDSVELATDLLEEIGWFGESDVKDPDYILYHEPAKS